MDMDEPMKHTFSVEDGQLIGRYEVEFTSIELNSMGSVCKTAVEIAGASNWTICFLILPNFDYNDKINHFEFQRKQSYLIPGLMTILIRS